MRGHIVLSQLERTIKLTRNNIFIVCQFCYVIVTYVMTRMVYFKCSCNKTLELTFNNEAPDGIAVLPPNELF